MAKHRPAVPAAIRRELLREAGNKCINPGCTTQLLEFHHIKEWAIYETHDAEHMVALCPTCHDSITRGSLGITDQDLYRWKAIERLENPTFATILPEPGPVPKLLLGSIAFQGNNSVTIFELAQNNRLAFFIEDGDLLMMRLRVRAMDGTALVKAEDGYVRSLDNSVQINNVPGHVHVQHANWKSLIPPHLLAQILKQDPLFGINGQPVLDLKVIDAGIVQIQGIWAEKNCAVVVSPDAIWIAQPKAAVALKGEGLASTIKYDGPVTQSVFHFAGL